MNETIRVLTERRSVRAYTSRMVDEETLQQILLAGEYAASGMGYQPGVMVVVQAGECLKQLSRMNAQVMGGSGDPFYGAPTVVIVLVDLDLAVCPVQDGSLIMGNLMNAAYALGVDSCWVNRAQEMFDSAEGKALLTKWGLKGRYQGVGCCLLGYGANEHPIAKPRKDGFIVRVAE